MTGAVSRAGRAAPRRRARTRWAGSTGLAALVVGGLLAGCSEEATTLDAEATEQAVAEVVSARIEPKVLETRCPSEIPLEQGATIDCALTLAASVGPEVPVEPVDAERAEGVLRVRVTQVDTDGKLEVVLRDAVVDVADVVLDLEAELKATFERSFDVSCGEVAHRVVAPEGTFACRARDKAGPRTVEVTVVDVAGTLRYQVLS